MTGRGLYALIFLINILFDLYTAAVILRFLLQWTRADFYNPLCQAIVKITNPLLLPLRRIIPGWRGLDFAAVALTLLLQIVNIFLVMVIVVGFPRPIDLAWWTLLKILFLLVNLYFITILVEAVLSWTNTGSRNPMGALLWRINAPLLQPIRKLIPPLGGLDFSPLVVLILLQFINILLPLQWPLR
ncbi:MAG: YggT family protein [Gammaproteobacteria bacterium]|nr:YggT family protein [Gammaproteobacteria bacterium]